MKFSIFFFRLVVEIRKVGKSYSPILATTSPSLFPCTFFLAVEKVNLWNIFSHQVYVLQDVVVGQNVNYYFLNRQLLFCLRSLVPTSI